MLRVVQDAKRIASLTRSVRARIKRHADWRGTHWVGFPGGRDRFPVAWVEEHGFFAAFEDHHNRSWNGFGLAKPGLRNTLPLVVEVNVPWRGINRTIGGVFVEDPTTGDVLLGQRGRIGGGRKGIGKEAFFHRYPRGQCVDVDDHGRVTKIALIGAVDSPDLLPALRTFIREVDRIKHEVTAGEPPHLAEFTPEFEGEARYRRTAATVVLRARHGTVVRALAAALKAPGYSVGNDRARDLFVLGRRGRMAHLFEVKTEVTTTSIYTAVGQLLVHGRCLDTAARLHLVLPLRPTARFARALTKLEIGVVTFDWNGGKPVFRGLP